MEIFSNRLSTSLLRIISRDTWLNIACSVGIQKGALGLGFIIIGFSFSQKNVFLAFVIFFCFWLY